MSQKEINGAFFDVVEECQGIVRNLEMRGRDIDDVEAVERAIEYAINRRFSDKPEDHLLYDVLRDGRRSVRRSRQRERRFTERYARLLPNQVTGKRRVVGDFIQIGNAADESFGDELEARVVEEARRFGEHGQRILDGLIAGETTREAAESAGISMATANRTIKRLRQRARQLDYEPNAV